MFGTINRGRQSGFTMIEVMVSLTILSIGVLGAVGLQIAAIQANTYGAQMTTATALAESKLATLLALTFTDPSLADNNTSNDPTTQGAPFLAIPATVANPSTYGDSCSDTAPLTPFGLPMAGATFTNGLGYQRICQIAPAVGLSSPGIIINVVVRFWDQQLHQYQQVQVCGAKSQSFQ